MTRSRQSTAYHEAGHAVVGAVLGRPVMEVTIIAGEDYGGRCTYGDQMKCGDPEFYASDEGRERLRRETISGAAGLES
jgi:ATP-dependent Zn protease